VVLLLAVKLVPVKDTVAPGDAQAGVRVSVVGLVTANVAGADVATWAPLTDAVAITDQVPSSDSGGILKEVLYAPVADEVAMLV